MNKRYEWPVSVVNSAGGRQTQLVEVRASEDATRAQLNEMAVKRAKEMGHTNVEPFFTEEPLPKGTYKLKADVVNPDVDRRYTRDWRSQAVIKAGTMLVCDDYVVGPNDVRRGLRGQEFNDFVMPHRPLYTLLVAQLERVAEEPSDLLLRLGFSHMGYAVLNQLARDGKITLTDVESALEAHFARSEAEA